MPRSASVPRRRRGSGPRQVWTALIARLGERLLNRFRDSQIVADEKDVMVHRWRTQPATQERSRPCVNEHKGAKRAPLRAHNRDVTRNGYTNLRRVCEARLLEVHRSPPQR